MSLEEKTNIAHETNEKQDIKKTAETPVKTESIKKTALKLATTYLIGVNMIYSVIGYGLRSDGLTAQQIRDGAKITQYDNIKKEYVPIEIDPIYISTIPGRELGMFLYEQFPNVFHKTTMKKE